MNLSSLTGSVLEATNGEPVSTAIVEHGIHADQTEVQVGGVGGGRRARPVVAVRALSVDPAGRDGFFRFR